MLNVSGFYGFTLLYLDYNLHSLFFGCLDLNGPKKNVLNNLEVGWLLSPFLGLENVLGHSAAVH